MFHRNPLAGAVALVVGSLAVPAFAAQTSSNAPGASADHLDTVVVLGTRRSDVTALESAAPVDVLSAQQLQQTGASTWSDARPRREAPWAMEPAKAPWGDCG